jgi:hypothetical protein
VKASPPRLACGASFGSGQEVLQGNVEESASGLGEHVARLRVAELGVDVEPPASTACQPRGERELAIDRHRLAVADEDPDRHGGELVPRGEQAAGLVERGRDQTAVDDARAGLVAGAEGEARLVALDPFLGRLGQLDPFGVVAAAPAERVVMRRDPRYRRPPRSKCAR